MSVCTNWTTACETCKRAGLVQPPENAADLVARLPRQAPWRLMLDDRLFAIADFRFTIRSEQ